jgi:dimethylargininase
VTAVSDGVLLANRAWIDETAFAGFDVIDVHPDEPSAANILRVGTQLLSAAAFPRTRDRLAARGFETTIVDASELAKAEGALTCCSLLLRLER